MIFQALAKASIQALAGFTKQDVIMTRTTPYRFINKRQNELAALIDYAPGSPRGFGIFAPCFTCTKESHAAFKICRALAALGITMLRFDIEGLGQSQGDFKNHTFASRVQDMIDASRALERDFGTPQLLIGHSISGTAAFAAARQIRSINVLATIGSPRSPAYVLDKMERNNQITDHGDVIDVRIANYTVTLNRGFIADMRSYDMKADIQAYKGKLFVFHGENDEIAGFDNAHEIYAPATCEKEMVVLSKSCDHLLAAHTDDAQTIAEKLAKAMGAIA